MRTGDRKACQSPKVLMGAWSGRGIFCFADADYTWRLPYAERECGKYDNCVHSVFRRRDDRGNDFLGNDEKSCRKDLK